MESKNDVLSVKDVLKIIGRKFFRLAPAYYGMWAFLYCMQSRISDGPIWHLSKLEYETCHEHWMPTLFMAGNILPVEQAPYTGCFWQAWPL